MLSEPKRVWAAPCVAIQLAGFLLFGGCAATAFGGSSRADGVGGKGDTAAENLVIVHHLAIPWHREQATSAEGSDWDHVASALAELSAVASEPEATTSVGMTRTALKGPTTGLSSSSPLSSPEADVLRRLGITGDAANQNRYARPAVPADAQVRNMGRLRPPTVTIGPQGVAPQGGWWSLQVAFKGLKRLAFKGVPYIGWASAAVDLVDAVEWVASNSQPIGDPALSGIPTASRDCTVHLLNSGAMATAIQAMDGCLAVDGYVALSKGEIEYVANPRETRAPSQDFLAPRHKNWLPQRGACTTDGHCFGVREHPEGFLEGVEWHTDDGLSQQVYAALPAHAEGGVRPSNSGSSTPGARLHAKGQQYLGNLRIDEETRTRVAWWLGSEPCRPLWNHERDLANLLYTFSGTGPQKLCHYWSSDPPERRQVAPTEAALDPAVIHYHHAQDAVVWDAEAVDDLVQEFGPYARTVVLAHEWGHHNQYHWGQFQPLFSQMLLAWLRFWTEGAADGLSSEKTAAREAYDAIRRVIEIQADCQVGMFTAFLQARGGLEPDDLQSALSYIRSIDEPLQHGTGDQRVAAFERGYLGAMSRVEDLFTVHPESLARELCPYEALGGS